MRMNRIKTALLVFAACAVLMTLCNRAPSYLSFTGRDKDYYADVANACEYVRNHTPPALSDGELILPNHLSLPAVLKRLHPEYLRVTTNRVYMSIGSPGRGSYGIAWAPGDFDSSTTWELRTYAENLEKVLYTRTEFKLGSPQWPTQ